MFQVPEMTQIAALRVILLSAKLFYVFICHFALLVDCVPYISYNSNINHG